MKMIISWKKNPYHWVYFWYKGKKDVCNYWIQKGFRKKNWIGLQWCFFPLILMQQYNMTYNGSENCIILEVSKRIAYFIYILCSLLGSVRVILKRTHIIKSFFFLGLEWGLVIGVRIGTGPRWRNNNINVKENHYLEFLWVISCWELTRLLKKD